MLPGRLRLLGQGLPGAGVPSRGQLVGILRVCALRRLTRLLQGGAAGEEECGMARSVGSVQCTPRPRPKQPRICGKVQGTTSCPGCSPPAVLRSLMLWILCLPAWRPR